MRPAAFNMGVGFGVLFMFCGLCLITGFPIALLALGAFLWLTSIITMHFAIAAKKAES